MKILLLLFAALLVAGCGEKNQAVVIGSGDGEELPYYHAGELDPYSGWAKVESGTGQIEEFGRIREGKREGPWEFYRNATYEKTGEYKDGKRVGPWKFSKVNRRNKGWNIDWKKDWKDMVLPSILGILILMIIVITIRDKIHTGLLK